MPSMWEFFSGGGMARQGVGDGWSCTFANDFSPMKGEAYRANWGSAHFIEGDVAAITAVQLPGTPDLVWASTPCQDMSLAGNGAGLGDEAAPATRSGAFWPWWRLMRQVIAEGRRPRIICFENVVGALTSNKGADFQALVRAFSSEGYRVGALVADARMFLPQSRPRLFIVAVDEAAAVPPGLSSVGPVSPWHPQSVQTAFDRLPEELRARWVWWNLPLPAVRVPHLSALIEAEPTGVEWHPRELTAKLISQMSPANAAKLRQAKALKKRVVGTAYRRTRSEGGQRLVRTECRFDGVAGCLRTPSGGSSRQTVLVVEGDKVRSRLLSPGELARLMGLPDDYRLPQDYNAAYHLAGDGVAVPVVAHLARFLFEPIAAASSQEQREMSFEATHQRPHAAA